MQVAGRPSGDFTGIADKDGIIFGKLSGQPGEPLRLDGRAGVLFLVVQVGSLFLA